MLSELRKGDRADRGVRSWFELARDDELFISVLTLGELRRGAELKRRKDAHGARAIEQWLAAMMGTFGDRIVPIDAEVADRWGSFSAVRPLPVIDGLLAATSLVHDLTLVTRNTDDFHGLEVRLLNPFGH